MKDFRYSILQNYLYIDFDFNHTYQSSRFLVNLVYVEINTYSKNQSEKKTLVSINI
jgi:hypothetical protein